ncbi:MAG: DeoR family transcriptional regulator [Ginsengibacter sp.]
MLKVERQTFILRRVNQHNKVLSTDLIRQIKVWDDTIRSDIRQLEEEDKVIKFHGSALSPSFHNTTFSKEVYAYQQKRPLHKKQYLLLKV